MSSLDDVPNWAKAAVLLFAAGFAVLVIIEAIRYLFSSLFSWLEQLPDWGIPFIQLVILAIVGGAIIDWLDRKNRGR